MLQALRQAVISDDCNLVQGLILVGAQVNCVEAVRENKHDFESMSQHKGLRFGVHSRLSSMGLSTCHLIFVRKRI